MALRRSLLWSCAASCPVGMGDMGATGMGEAGVIGVAGAVKGVVGVPSATCDGGDEGEVHAGCAEGAGVPLAS